MRVPSGTREHPNVVSDMNRRKQTAEADDYEWVTLKAAARALREAPATTLKRGLRGELTITSLAGFTFVRRDTLDVLLAAAAA